MSQGSRCSWNYGVLEVCDGCHNLLRQSGQHGSHGGADYSGVLGSSLSTFLFLALKINFIGFTYSRKNEDSRNSQVPRNS